MSIHRLFDSNVYLISRDERFKVAWRNGFLPEVESASILHRKRTPWPKFGTPDDFNNLVIGVEKILEVEFDLS